ncbi:MULTISPECIES: hypothetical protein [Paenibacillus]|uniref:ABC-2 transporter permease n=1 Tax=Paenibacillus agri TaxID=2744309 RepID=A0A850EGI4_9BACL|nr:hypothetical protein [Paenibacillus agri]NUU58970.1 hypothetical protein [Paenibacillus agri]
MNALLWKSFQTLKQQKIRGIVFLLLPVGYLFVLKQSGLSEEMILVLFPATFTLFSSVIHFSMENVISSESILATPITIRKVWLWNLIFIIATGYLYSILLLTVMNLIGFMSIPLSVEGMTQFAAYLTLCFAFLGASNCHYADYSYTKQLIASVFAIINLAGPFLLLLMGSKAEAYLDHTWMIITIAFFIFGFSFIIMLHSSKEKLLMNTQKLVTVYNNTNIIEE